MTRKEWVNRLYGSNGVITDIMNTNEGINVNDLGNKRTLLLHKKSLIGLKSIQNCQILGETESTQKKSQSIETGGTSTPIASGSVMDPTMSSSGVIADEDKDKDKDEGENKVSEGEKKKQADKLDEEKGKEEVKKSLTENEKQIEAYRRNEARRKTERLKKEKERTQGEIAASEKKEEEAAVISKKKWALAMDSYAAWEYMTIDDINRQTSATLHTLDIQRMAVFLERELSHRTSFYLGGELRRFNFDDPDSQAQLRNKIELQKRFHLGVHYSTLKESRWSLRYSWGEEFYLKAIDTTDYEFVDTMSHTIMLQYTYHIFDYKKSPIFLSPSISYSIVDDVGTLEPDSVIAFNLIPSMSVKLGKNIYTLSLYNQYKMADTNASEQSIFTIGLSLAAFIPNIF